MPHLRAVMICKVRRSADSTRLLCFNWNTSWADEVDPGPVAAEWAGECGGRRPRRRWRRPATMRDERWRSRWTAEVDKDSATCDELFPAGLSRRPSTNNVIAILAHCLIYAWPLPAHPRRDQSAVRSWPAQGHDLTDDWSLPSAHFVDSWCPFQCSFGCVLSLNQMFWKQCTVRQYHSDLSDQSALEIRVMIWVRLELHYLSIFHGE